MTTAPTHPRLVRLVNVGHDHVVNPHTLGAHHVVALAAIGAMMFLAVYLLAVCSELRKRYAVLPATDNRKG